MMKAMMKEEDERNKRILMDDINPFQVRRVENKGIDRLYHV